MNLDDVVEVVESAEGAPVAVRVIEPSSNRTFRVHYPGAADEDTRWRQLLVDMEPLDCWFDVLSPAYLALSVPEPNAAAVEGFLGQRAQGGDLTYERAAR